MPDDYIKYMESSAWDNQKQARLDFADHRCELCNRQSNLNVHHRTYDNFGDEPVSDLIVLCKTCHDTFHQRLALHGGSPPMGKRDKILGIDPQPVELDRSSDDLRKSGFDDLDKLIGGFFGGDLICIAGRPSMGKTSLALSFARSISGAAIFSLESTHAQIANRLLCAEAGVSLQRLRTTDLTEDERQRVNGAIGKLEEPLHIHSADSLTVEELEEEANSIRRRGAQAIIVDSADQLSLSNGSDQWRRYQLEEIARRLKALALSVRLPVIVTTGIDGKVETRGGDKRPSLGDLAAPALEDHADLVLMLYRPERYGITVDENGEVTESTAEVIISKQRNGPTGTVEVNFDAEHFRFTPIETNTPDDSDGPVDIFGPNSPF